jgi:hypothetical protein
MSMQMRTIVLEAFGGSVPHTLLTHFEWFSIAAKRFGLMSLPTPSFRPKFS